MYWVLFVSNVRRSANCLLLCAILVSCQKPAAENQSPQPPNAPDKSAASTIANQMSTKEASAMLMITPASLAAFRLRLEAVKQLGESRSVEAVPLLVERLTKISPFLIDNAADFEQTFPVTVALVQIGEPAVTPLKERFEATSAKPEQLVLLYTLFRIKGKDWVAGYIDQLKKENKGVTSKERLEELRRWVNSQ